MPNLFLAAVNKWFSESIFAKRSRIKKQKREDIPPPLPFRCGTMLLRLDSETARNVASKWQEDEERFIAWVVAHPAPRAEWLESVERLKRRHA